MLKKVKVKVFAKVNLSLNVLSKGSVFHNLDMVLSSVDIFDVVTVAERWDENVNIKFDFKGISDGESGEIFIDEKNNTIRKMTELLRAQFGSFGADIFVEKNIPVRGGLGGSSADAAGVLCAFDNMFGFISRGLDAPSAALKVGSDVPYMLKGGYCRVSGAGERVSAIDNFNEFFFALILPEGGVSTKDCFNQFDKIYKDKKCVLTDNDALVSCLIKGDKRGAASHFANSLFTAASRLNSGIVEAVKALEEIGAVVTTMTGSGCGCLGLFEDKIKADEAAAKLRAAGFNALSIKTVQKGIEIL